MSAPTKSQQSAIQWLYDAGGNGSIQRGGVILCGGQRGRFMPETWLHLTALGMVEPDGPKRLKISESGAVYCRQKFGAPDVMRTGSHNDACEDEFA